MLGRHLIKEKEKRGERKKEKKKETKLYEIKVS